MKKTLTALAAAATLAIVAVGAPTDAFAQRRGGAVAAGVLGGLAAGAIIGGALAGPRRAIRARRRAGTVTGTGGMRTPDRG